MKVSVGFFRNILCNIEPLVQSDVCWPSVPWVWPLVANSTTSFLQWLMPGRSHVFPFLKSYLSLKVNESHRLKEHFRIIALWTLTALTLTSFENEESRHMVLLILHVTRSQRQNMLPPFSVSSREHVKEIATSKLST